MGESAQILEDFGFSCDEMGSYQRTGGKNNKNQSRNQRDQPSFCVENLAEAKQDQDNQEGSHCKNLQPMLFKVLLFQLIS